MVEGWHASILLSRAGMIVSWLVSVSFALLGWTMAPFVKIALVSIYALVIYPSFFRTGCFTHSSLWIPQAMALVIGTMATLRKSWPVPYTGCDLWLCTVDVALSDRR